MASDDSGGVRVTGSERVETRDGDDIVVVPGEAPDRRSRRPWFVIGAVAAVALVAAVVFAATRDSTSKATVQPIVNTDTQQSTPAHRASLKTTNAKSRATHAEKAATTKRTPTTQRPAAVIGKPATVQPTLPAASAPTTPAAAPTTTVPKQSDPHVLQWTIIPRDISVPAGKATTVALSARNPSDGVVDLPHPLSCAPRLDHTEICSEQTQPIGPGQVATARWTIDATNFKAGRYTLIVEGGLVTITVNVS